MVGSLTRDEEILVLKLAVFDATVDEGEFVDGLVSELSETVADVISFIFCCLRCFSNAF